MKSILAAVVCAAALLAQENSASLLGRWRPVVTSKGGIGTVFEFRAKGVLLLKTGAIVESTYSVEGTELVSPPPTLNGPPVRQVLDFREPGVLRLWYGKEMTAELRRVGTGEGLLGEWVGQREMNGMNLEMRMIFDAQGKQLFVMPFKTERASYRIRAGRMEIIRGEGKGLAGGFSVSESRLELPGWKSAATQSFLRY